MFNRRPAKGKDIKDLQKEYRSNPTKYFFIMVVIIMAYITSAVLNLQMMDKVPQMDGSKELLLITSIACGVVIIVSATIGIGANFKKRLLLTPVFCEYKHGKKRFRTLWRDLSFWEAGEMGYKCIFFNENGIKCYVDSMFFDKYAEISKIANTAKKRAMSKESIDI